MLTYIKITLRQIETSLPHTIPQIVILWAEKKKQLSLYIRKKVFKQGLKKFF